MEKFNFFNKSKTAIKKGLTIGAIIGSSLFAHDKLNAQNQKQDSLNNKIGSEKEIIYDETFKPILEQRKVYGSKVEYEKYVNESLAREIKEFEEEFNDPTFSEEGRFYLKNLINERKNIAKVQIDNYEKIAEPYLKSFKDFDEQKEWLKNNISSDEYKKRLVEFEKLDKSEQDKRLKNIESDYVLSRNSSFDTKTKKVEVEVSSDQPKMIHEGTHQSVNGEENMSSYSKDLYKKAYRKNNQTFEESVYDSLNTVKGDSYYGNPSELNSRKKVLEYDMDRLGVKKYGEKFTMEHYWKLIKLAIEGKLSDNSVEFLKRIDSKFIEQIMNTIAMNKSTQGSENSSI